MGLLLSMGIPMKSGVPLGWPSVPGSILSSAPANDLGTTPVNDIHLVVFDAHIPAEMSLCRTPV
ncbi:hypothetical protein BX661DRAFT_189246, partial [Kickxella alabastrina]|uniref:uncharacterized protein n=1 Tax=Kickxella alabastrina TaxID=61397 RepID=UPI002220CB8E